MFTCNAIFGGGADVMVSFGVSSDYDENVFLTGLDSGQAVTPYY